MSSTWRSSSTACKREFGVEANVGRPQVAYRETIRKRAEKVEGKFVRQTGGRGQYGHVVINIEPGATGQRLHLRGQDRRWCRSRGSTSARSRQGIREALDTGILAGYPVIDVKVELIDGSYHDVDSSEMAFKIAGSMAMKEGVRRAKPVLLEPDHGRRSGDARRSTWATSSATSRHGAARSAA